MTTYIITIRRDGPHAESSGQTTVRFDLSTGRPRVQELLVTAGDDTGLAPSDLPNIDLELLVRALGGALAAKQAIAVQRADASPVTTVGRKRGLRSAARIAASKRSGSGATKRRVSGAGVGDSTSDQSGRSYRRMPDPEEVLAAYQQTGTISALAEYYRVPRHTAQGWAGRLRRQGYKIGRS
jgi:hypothetical protein